MTQREKNIEELKKLSNRVVGESSEITRAVEEAKIKIGRASCRERV